MPKKLVLTELTIERLRELAYAQGRSKEWFDAWLEECVDTFVPLTAEHLEALRLDKVLNDSPGLIKESYAVYRRTEDD